VTTLPVAFGSQKCGPSFHELAALLKLVAAPVSTSALSLIRRTSHGLQFRFYQLDAALL
jgi:hypothetical protein